MSKISVFQKARNLARAFLKNRDGNLSTVFALASLPLVGFVGAAVDYTHVNAARTAMHQALDATALMLSKEVTTLNKEQMDAKATAYFKALYTRPEVTDIKITPSFTTTDGSQVLLTGSGLVKNSFMGILGISTVKITGSSTVAWGQARLRVALALDTTGSMDSDGKMDAMKKAAKALIDQLKTAATKDGDVYVSIIPFSKGVNVGTDNKDRDWIRWSGQSDTWDENNGKCKNYDSKSEPKYKSRCLDKDGTWTPSSHSNWNGCVMDRDKDYDISNAVPDKAIAASQFPAENSSGCPAQLMAMSYDWAALKTKIDALYPSGNTNQVIGLQWAFQSLTASPFTIPDKAKNYSYSEIIILMTDGLNTESRYSSTQTDIDTREKKLCDNIKTAKITLYTIHVNTGGDPAQQVLKDCAGNSVKWSDPDKHFEIKKANQLVTVFTQIGTALTQLRVAK